jgi:hypothetical protein
VNFDLADLRIRRKPGLSGQQIASAVDDNPAIAEAEGGSGQRDCPGA